MPQRQCAVDQWGETRVTTTTIATKTKEYSTVWRRADGLQTAVECSRTYTILIRPVATRLRVHFCLEPPQATKATTTTTTIAAKTTARA